MAAKINSSSEFVFLVRELHKQPNDPTLKQEVVRRIPQMVAMSKNSPLDLYRLAQVYAPTSPQYKNMMRQSAAGGCTNAMLSLCQLLLKTGSSADLKTAIHYIQMIERSRDSYIMKQSKQLLESYPQLAAQIKEQSKSSIGHPNIGFFARKKHTGNDEEVLLNERHSNTDQNGL